MKKYKKKISDIQDVLFERSKRAKRINISIRPVRGIRVAVPYGFSFKQAEAVFKNNISWVREKMIKIKKIEDRQPLFGLSGQVETNWHRLKIIPNGSEKFNTKIRGADYYLYVPEGLNIENDSIQSAIRSVLIEIYRSEAKEYLPARVKELAGQHGFHYNRVYIKCQKTLWGSCSGKLNINLNLNLMRIPEELREYIIFHELVHTKIPNHSQEFWQKLAEYIDDPEQKDKQLKNYNIRFYLP
jgi:predicted metal-dependent hydrolase